MDGSIEQITRARRAVPDARFIHDDMCAVEFPPGSFDAIGAFYSITHVPPDDQAGLLRAIAGWLKPGGRLVASLGTGARGDWTGDWLGTEMFFGHESDTANLATLADAGLVIRCTAVVQQDNEDASFRWIDAVKP